MLNKNKISNLIPHFGSTTKNMFSWKQLETLINLRPFITDDRFVIVDVPYANLKYKWNNPWWATETNGWMPTQIADALSKTSAYIMDCSKANKKINAFCHKLETMFKKNVDCHIYFSINKNLPNFNKHKDVSHNLIIVTDGQINCKIWTEKGMIEKNLSNGDYAFIPVDVYHQIDPITNKRISLSFAITLKDSEHYEDRNWIAFT